MKTEPFKVGDPVRDTLSGKEGKVIKVLDSVKLLYEYDVKFPDGWSAFYMGHELTKIEPSEGK